MSKETIYTAIDLGTSKVCTIISRVSPDGELQVLGMGVVPSQGVQKGMVVNIAEAQEAIKASLDEAQRYLGRGVSWAYVGITGNHITCLNTTAVFRGPGEDETLSMRDVQHLIQSSYPEVEPGKEVLHIIPRSYVVDGLRGVRNPVGLHAEEVQVESNVVLGEVPAVKNLVKAIEGCGISVRSLVLGPVAAGEAALSEDEREMGVVLADIGAGTTDVGIFRGGSLSYTAVIPVGGYQVTRDLSIALGIPYYYAEEAKVKWGHALPDLVGENEEVLLPTFQGGPRRAVKRQELCMPLHERLVETLKLILLKVRQSGLERMPPGGLVLTGGTSELMGLDELARRIIPSPVRTARPRGIPGLPQELKKPAFSTSVGILLWGIKHHGERREYRDGERTLWGYRALFRRLRKQAARLG